MRRQSRTGPPLTPAMDQDFYSIPQMDEEAVILEEMELEFKRIAPFCPEGEKAFERLLELLDKLLTARSAADTDPHAHQDAKEPDLCDSGPQMLQLQREVEKQKEENRMLRQELEESEEENEKLLALKSMSETQTLTLQRHMQSHHNQLEDQISHLTEKLHAEEKKVQQLEQTLIVMRNQYAGRRKEAITVKSLDQELREVGVAAGTQTEGKERKRRGPCLQLVHLGSELVESASTPFSLIRKLHWIRFLIFLIICFYTQCPSSLIVLFDDIVTHVSDRPAL